MWVIVTHRVSDGERPASADNTRSPATSSDIGTICTGIRDIRCHRCMDRSLIVGIVDI